MTYDNLELGLCASLARIFLASMFQSDRISKPIFWLCGSREFPESVRPQIGSGQEVCFDSYSYANSRLLTFTNLMLKAHGQKPKADNNAWPKQPDF